MQIAHNIKFFQKVLPHVYFNNFSDRFFRSKGKGTFKFRYYNEFTRLFRWASFSSTDLKKSSALFLETAGKI